MLLQILYVLLFYLHLLPLDLFETCVLRSVNFFTEFVINTDRIEYGEAQLIRYLFIFISPGFQGMRFGLIKV